MKQEKCIPFLCKERNEEIRESYRLTGVSYDCGYANGYVAVPKSHPWYGKDCTEVDNEIDIHGGLTFSGQLDKDFHLTMLSEDKLPEDYWAFGFDTMHFHDTLETCDEDFCKAETMRLKKQLEAVSSTSSS